MKKMEICTQSDLHGVRHGKCHIRNDVSYSPTGGLTHSSTRWEDGVLHLDMAFAILCEIYAVRKWTHLVFHSSHDPLFFLPRTKKVSLDILGLRIIINSRFTFLFWASKLSTNISHKFSIIRALLFVYQAWSTFVLKLFIFPHLHSVEVYFRLPALYQIKISDWSRFLFYSVLFTL